MIPRVVGVPVRRRPAARLVEEERLTRVKKAKQAAVDNAHVWPYNAIAYCLGVAQAGWDEIAFIGYS
jgi:hypothetical protein